MINHIENPDSDNYSSVPWFNQDDLYTCVHCGFCLQACPTYLETGLESESPRGRISLMKGVNEGRIPINDTVLSHWDMCIQCRACESVCPSGVPYGNLIEDTMANVKKIRKNNIIKRFMLSVMLNKLVTKSVYLKSLIFAMRIYYCSGLRYVVRKTKILNLIWPKLYHLEKLMPNIYGRPFKANNQTYKTNKKNSIDVQFFSGCIMPMVQGDQMRNAVDVLTQNGCNVNLPSTQQCCGAINSHVGDMEVARDLAKKNIEAFTNDFDVPIIVNSAGCGARMKEYTHLLKDDDEYFEKSEKFAKRVKDINEFLNEIPLTYANDAFKCSVTYQDSCHLSNAQGIRQAPRSLLNKIPGVEFKELSESNICCGAGGTYMFSQQEMSGKVLIRKIENIQTTQAEIVATANPGCFMQLEKGISDAGLSIKVKYITDILKESYSNIKNKE
jgi:glycolate oxidase iron-sulfur subunit